MINDRIIDRIMQTQKEKQSSYKIRKTAVKTDI